MSSLWTPGGEIPVDRDRTPQDQPPPDRPGGPPPVGDAGAGSDEAAHYEEMQRQVLAAPAAEVVVQHAASLFELAALHLSQDEPRLADVRVLVDALGALVDGLGARLGDSGQALAAALPQLKMAYVEAVDRASPPSSGGEGARPVD